MKKMLFISGLAVCLCAAAPSFAQDASSGDAPAEEPASGGSEDGDAETGESGGEAEEAEDTDSEETGDEASDEAEGDAEGESADAAEGDAVGDPADGEDSGAEEESGDAEAADAAPADGPAVGTEAEATDEGPADNEMAESDDDSDGFEASPIADLASQQDDEEFVPLEDIEEGALEQIIPADVFPRVEWNGYFRARTEAAINYDLDTEGTSAILPPLGSQGSNPADSETNNLWSTNLRLRLDPTIHITDSLRVFLEADLLDNLVLGSLPASRRGVDPLMPDVSVPTNAGGQFSPENALRINEAYGEISTIFGTLAVGRMDAHWGLGVFDNDGDCLDCDYGTHLDRALFTTRIFGIDGGAAIDFPNEGLTSRAAGRVGGQPYDMGQVDDADQYSFYLSVSPKRDEDFQLQRKRLFDDDAVVINGGGLFRIRNQDGEFAAPGDDFPNTLPALTYTGLDTYSADAWVQFLYEPDFDTYVRVELEALSTFGSIDNASGQPVGGATESADAVNCFEAGASEERCVTNEDGESLSRDIFQLGLALETEFRFGEMVSWGLNGGLASGGDTPNWGTSGAVPDFDFYRFNPDYHVDLILFRRVIGTVTNAVYYNPYVRAEFLKSGMRKMEFQVDTIFSHAWDAEGTPSGESLLGLEFDAALRYILTDTFSATLEGGILFPFAGLDAEQGRERYQGFDTNLGQPFNDDRDASLAWTVQGKIGWTF